jgi:ABC-type molybdate transport system permease subunit
LVAELAQLVSSVMWFPLAPSIVSVILVEIFGDNGMFLKFYPDILEIKLVFLGV